MPPAHWSLAACCCTKCTTQSPAYPDVRRYDLRSRAWPFLLHGTVPQQSRGGVWRVRNPALIPVCTCNSSSCRTRGGAAKQLSLAIDQKTSAQIKKVYQSKSAINAMKRKSILLNLCTIVHSCCNSTRPHQISNNSPNSKKSNPAYDQAWFCQISRGSHIPHNNTPKGTPRNEKSQLSANPTCWLNIMKYSELNLVPYKSQKIPTCKN